MELLSRFTDNPVQNFAHRAFGQPGGVGDVALAGGGFEGFKDGHFIALEKRQQARCPMLERSKVLL